MERLTGARRDDENYPRSSSVPLYGNNEEELVLNNSTFSSQISGTYDSPAEEEYADDSEGQLTIDVYQTDTEVVIKSTIAGVKPEDLDVSINNDMITIKGERRNEESVSSENYYYQECYWGGFSRSVVLPVEVIAEKIEASLKNGILTIKLPKADTTKTKRIPVRGF